MGVWAWVPEPNSQLTATDTREVCVFDGAGSFVDALPCPVEVLTKNWFAFRVKRNVCSRSESSYSPCCKSR